MWGLYADVNSVLLMVDRALSEDTAAHGELLETVAAYLTVEMAKRGITVSESFPRLPAPILLDSVMTDIKARAGAHVPGLELGYIPLERLFTVILEPFVRLARKEAETPAVATDISSFRTRLYETWRGAMMGDILVGSPPQEGRHPCLTLSNDKRAAAVHGFLKRGLAQVRLCHHNLSWDSCISCESKYNMLPSLLEAKIL